MERPSLSSFMKNQVSAIQKEDLVSDDMVIKHLRGPKGDAGEVGKPGKDAEPPTVEELEALILPLIPEPIPGVDGKDGKTPNKTELLSLIKPLIPSPIPGERGQTPTTQELEALITPLIPKLEKEELSPKELIEKINKARGSKIKRDKVEGLDEVEGIARTAQRQVQNFISLGGNRQTKVKVNGVVYTGVDTLTFTSGVTATPVGDGTELQLAVTGGSGGSGYQAPLTGGLTGTNTWSTAPNVLVIDGVPRQKVQTDGTVMWTGTTTTVLTGAPLPTFDIFSSA